MNSRVALILSGLFWLTMNCLLWRSEYGGGSQRGSSVPVELVWRKIITAPDNSTLDVYHHGKKMGYCRWTAGTGQFPLPAGDTDDGLPPQKPANQPLVYRLELDGNIALTDAKNRVQFNVELKLETNRIWREFNLHLSVPDTTLAVHSLAAEKNLRLRSESDGEKTERTLTFADLRNPRALAKTFDLPLPLAFFDLPGLTTNAQNDKRANVGLVWNARNDWLTMGHVSVRVYRLGTRLLDRFSAAIFVSPVGEIMRVELPDEWVLVNDQTGNL